MKISELFFDFFYRYRSSRRVWPSFFSSGAGPSPASLNPDAKIVVVGLGISALTFLEQLYQAGYKNVHLISQDTKFGGKCVHSGCIPSEAFWLNPQTVQEQVQKLASLSEENFRSWAYPLHLASVQSIEGKTLLFSSGEQLAFDVLVLATGNQVSPWENLVPTLKPENFWNLTASQHLVIVSAGEATAWSYADMANAMKVNCTLIEIQASPLENLPSFSFFRRQIRKRGTGELSKARILLQNQKEKKLSVRTPEGHHEITYDELLFLGPPSPRLPQIDHKSIGIFDIDLENSCLKKRQDIFVLGDSAGFLTAAEAEGKALKLAWQLTGQGPDLDLSDLSRLPLRLHGKQSWASTGNPLSLLARHWQELDFKKLGWSQLHEGEGKLWYLFNPGTQKIEALQICHAQAAELISLGASLLHLPVTDPLWLSCSVHPSAAEIFKLLQLKIRRDHPELFQKINKSQISLGLPSVSVLRQNHSEFFTAQEFQSSQLEKDPWIYLGKVLLRKHLELPPDQKLDWDETSAESLKLLWKNKSYEVRRI